MWTHEAAARYSAIGGAGTARTTRQNDKFQPWP